MTETLTTKARSGARAVLDVPAEFRHLPRERFTFLTDGLLTKAAAERNVRVERTWLRQHGMACLVRVFSGQRNGDGRNVYAAVYVHPMNDTCNPTPAKEN